MEKELILDYSRWRCGGSNTVAELPDRALGQGRTVLQNNEGYQCCLGQFILQLDDEITEHDIIGQAYPVNMRKLIPLLTVSRLSNDYSPEEGYVYPLNDLVKDSEFSLAAVVINDDTSTTVEEKIKN